MGLFGNDKPKAERQADNDRHKALKRAQDNYLPRDRNEDATARQLNAARAENEQHVSWWRR